MTESDATSDDRPLAFTVESTERRARVGRGSVGHGDFETPAFLPVASHGSVQGLTPRDLWETGTQLVVADAFDLTVSPGEETVEKHAGLHRMMGWLGPLVTHSGSESAFEMPDVEVDESGVTADSDLLDHPVELTPEESIAIQETLGADIILAFDVSHPHPCEYDRARDDIDRTSRWLKRCADAHSRSDQALFGIIQGSVYPDLRGRSTEKTLDVELPGYAIGGLAGGERHESTMEMLDHTVSQLPDDKPRYLPGVGHPEDVVEGVARGVDLFDCAVPTSHAHSGIVYSRRGRMTLTHREYRNDRFPLDANCNCYACRNFSRAYIRHLIETEAILGTSLVAVHNLTFYQDLMRTIRRSIESEVFQQFRFAFLDEYLSDRRARELNLFRLEDAYDLAALEWDTTHSVLPPTEVDEETARIDPYDNFASPEERIGEITG